MNRSILFLHLPQDSSKPVRRACAIAGALISICGFSSPGALARGGGGHTSFSGHASSRGSYGHSTFGSSSYYSGSGYGGPISVGGGGSNLGQFILLIFILLILFFWISRMRALRSAGEDGAAALLHRGREADLPAFDPEKIRQYDANFSEPAFIDFAYALYATLHHFRGLRKLSALSPYLSSESIATYETISPSVGDVKGVLVSALHLLSAEATESDLKIRLNFQANYTETRAGLADQSFYTEEKWILSKKKTTVSLIPEKLRQIACPACGAQPAFTDDGHCSACGNLILRGDFNWVLERVNLQRHQTPPLLTETVEEEGTDLPSVIAPNLIAAENKFANSHTEFRLSDFKKHVEKVYFAVQSAWTERIWETVRPYESENIFQMHCYWIQEYQKQGMINLLQDVTLSQIEVVKLTQDPFFESMTVRIYGSMIDYTVLESNQKVIAGNPRIPRSFTEYWTFIRSSKSSSLKKQLEGCPACGAPLKINQAGHCEYCKALITSGDFDWVLSTIEQDEEYLG